MLRLLRAERKTTEKPFQQIGGGQDPRRRIVPDAAWRFGFECAREQFLDYCSRASSTHFFIVARP